MADWAKPTVLSNYVTFVDEVKNRDVDAITLQLNALVSPPVGSIRLLRTPTKFQEWNGTTFVDKILSVEGGGTGSNTISGIGSSLGLGTMAYQNANAVTITGGSATLYLSGCTGQASLFLDNCTIRGTTGVQGPTNFSSNIYVVNTNPGGHALQVTETNSALYAGFFSHSGSAQKLGVLIRVGSGPGDQVLNLQNYNGSQNFILVRGDGAMIFAANGSLSIPVGVNRYVPA